jgi:hypothetical protein
VVKSDATSMAITLIIELLSFLCRLGRGSVAADLLESAAAGATGFIVQ